TGDAHTGHEPADRGGAGCLGLKREHQGEDRRKTGPRGTGAGDGGSGGGFAGGRHQLTSGRYQVSLARRSFRCADSPPVLLLASAKRPPMRITERSTMDRPSPVPVAELRDASPRKNGWVSRFSMSMLTPVPWSRTLIRTESFLILATI